MAHAEFQICTLQRNRESIGSSFELIWNDIGRRLSPRFVAAEVPIPVLNILKLIKRGGLLDRSQYERAQIRWHRPIPTASMTRLLKEQSSEADLSEPWCRFLIANLSFRCLPFWGVVLIVRPIA